MHDRDDFMRKKFLNQDYIDSFTDSGETKPMNANNIINKDKIRDPVILSAIHMTVGGRDLAQYSTTKLGSTELTLKSIETIELAGFSVVLISVLYATLVVSRFLLSYFGERI